MQRLVCSMVGVVLLGALVVSPARAASSAPQIEQTSSTSFIVHWQSVPGAVRYEVTARGGGYYFGRTGADSTQLAIRSGRVPDSLAVQVVAFADDGSILDSAGPATADVGRIAWPDLTGVQRTSTRSVRLRYDCRWSADSPPPNRLEYFVERRTRDGWVAQSTGRVHRADVCEPYPVRSLAVPDLKPTARYRARLVSYDARADDYAPGWASAKSPWKHFTVKRASTAGHS